MKSSRKKNVTQNEESRKKCVIHYLSKESSLEDDDKGNLAVQLRTFLRDKQYHKEGRSDHKLFTFLADVIPNGIVITDKNHKIEWVNKAYTSLTGYSFKESIGRKPGELLQGKKVDVAKKKRMSDKLSRHIPFTEELLNYKKNGESFWIRISIAPVFDENNEIQNYIGIQEDITERKLAELQAEQNSKVLEAISEQANFSIFLKDGEGRYLYVNPEWRRQFGLDKKTVVGKTASQLLDKNIARALKSQDRMVLKENKPVLGQELITNGHGPKYYAISKFPVKGISGIKKGIAGIAADITEFKLIEEKIKKSESRLNLAQRIGNIGSWELNLEENELVWTDEIYRIFEIDPDQFGASYESFLDLIHPDDREIVDQAYTDSLQNNTPYHIKHRLLFPDGRVKHVEEHGETFYNEEGIPIRTIGTVQDITESKLIQKQLEDSLHEQTVLLLEIHHRVKNNLALVSGIMQLQAFETTNKETQKFLADGQSRIKSIAIIHELLYQSKSFSKVNLKENFLKMIEHTRHAMNSNVKIDVDLDLQNVSININQAIPCSLILNELLTNVYKHAFKNRPHGIIELSLKEKNEMVEIKIRDDGNGLPGDFNLEKPSSLGLTLIKTITQQLDGHLEYSSDKKGTQFKLTFQKKESKGSSSNLI
ncbi:MAG: PAS domain S-box protein [Gracilimonas sp.]|uniref:sensor histidine kinase n=1 Tax=Gracilimonas sp. TaxID=1974203 RepID=UPI0019C0F669|nr:PAS domain S-box protein [Gracilimonas sp.]MBD3615744.1 PAS domain S-box protein [Gracilimonas sp.]